MKALVSLLLPFVLSAEDCATLLQQARVAYESKQYAVASRDFEVALVACSRRNPILLDLARAQFMAQEFESADSTLQELLRLEPANGAALKLRGDTVYLLGREPEAEKLLLAAAAADPRSPEPRYALGRIYYQQNRFQDSITQLQSVLQLDPGSYRAWDNIGLAYEGLNDIPHAFQHYQKALELVQQIHPSYDWVYGNMSNLLYRQGEYKRAFQFGAEAANRNPNSARNFFLTGKALAKLEKWELAAKWLGQSVTLDPAYADARYQYSQVLRKLGRVEEANAQLEAFREISAKQPRKRR